MLDLCGKVTEIGLMKTMTISYFKAHISEQLRKVRKGARIVISDRDTPIAEVLPYRPESTSISVRGPLVTPFAAPPSSFKIDHDPIEYLLEDRGRR
jgi:prevent-host-death family protein